mgnify:CR=1 FL=1
MSVSIAGQRGKCSREPSQEAYGTSSAASSTPMNSGMTSSLSWITRNTSTPTAPAIARKRQDHSLAVRTPEGTLEASGALFCSAERNTRNMRQVYEPTGRTTRVAGAR